MSSNAISSQGAELRIGNGASVEVFTAIPELKNVNISGMTSEDIQTTHLGSVGYHDYIAGLKEAGEASGEVNWTQSGYATLLALFDSGVNRNMELELANGVIYEFAGRIKSIPITAAANDAVKFNLVVKMTGTFVEQP